MAAGEERGYDAFISYSHRLDAAITARLQAELQRFAKPWYRMRALHVFRDETSLAASPHLWTTIEEALADSSWLILMASPESAQSGWVSREISWWRVHRPMNHLLIAVTEGELVWDGTAGDLDWAATTALSKEALGHAFSEEPRWVDVRWARDTEDGLRSADPRLQDAVADLAAAIRHVPKDSLIGEHIRRRRRAVQAVVAVAAALVVLLAISLTAAFIAKGQRDRADRENTVATAGLLASTAVSLTGSRPDLAQLFAVQAYRLDPGNPQARAALFATVQADPQVERFLVAPGPVSALAISPDGRMIVAGTRNGWVRGWNLARFTPVSYGRMDGPVTGVAVSADGSTVAAATGLSARTWVHGRMVASRAAPPGTPFTAVGVSPSGKFAAFAAYPRLDVLSTPGRSWRQARLAGFGTWHRGRPPLVTNLAVPSDTELVALDGRYGSWRRLALPGLTTAGSARNTFGPSRYPAYTYALSPAGTLFTHSYVAAGSSLRVLSTRRSGRAAGRPAERARPGGRLALALAISRNGRWVASEDASGIHVSRIAGPAGPARPPRSYPGAEPLFSTSLAFVGSGDSRLISASGNLLTLWNLGQYSRIGRAARIPMPWRCGRVCPGPRLAIGPGGGEAALTDSNGDLLVRAGLGPSFGKITTLAKGGTEQFGLPLWSRTGNRLYVFGRTLSLLNAGKGRAVMVRKDPDPPQALALSADGNRLFAVDAAGTVRTGAVPAGAAASGPVVRGPVLSGPVVRGPRGIRPNTGLYQRQAAVSPSGTRAAVIDQSNQEVYVINLRTRRTWRVPGVKAYELAYSGSHLVLQRENGDIDLRNADGTRVIRSVQAGTPWNYGNIAVGPGPAAGQVLVAGERADGRGIVTDLGSGHLLGVFPIGKASPYQQTTMAFTPGGRSLVTVTEGNSRTDDGVLTQLSLTPAQWVRVACTTSGHGLTPGDWRRYISPSPPARLGCAR
ncbi:MAG: toll/interleukin-1 receptor domain-containing protein [Streptosporangiaceae bacterium]